MHMHKSKLDLFRMLQNQRPQFIASVVFAMRPCIARTREVRLGILRHGEAGVQIISFIWVAKSRMATETI